MTGAHRSLGDVYLSGGDYGDRHGGAARYRRLQGLAQDDQDGAGTTRQIEVIEVT
jgi:hypothetical protein